MARRVGILLLLAVTFTTSGVILAHGDLLSARPAPGEVVNKPPAQIELRFSQNVASGNILLTSIGGDTVTVTMLNPDTEDQLAARVDDEIVEGEYSVIWMMTSIDGHMTNGSYNFRYAPEKETSGGFTWFTYVWGTIFVVVTIAAWIWARRWVLRRGTYH